MNDGSSAHSISSLDEDPENTLMHWKEKCLQLEMLLQDVQSTNSLLSSNDVEIQCSIDENEQKENPDALIDKELLNKLNDENEQLKTEINTLNEKNEQWETETNVLNEKNEQSKSEIHTLNEINEQLKTEINVLKEEINNLNFQLSSISMQRSTTTDVST